jgi:hypothetical protein
VEVSEGRTAAPRGRVDASGENCMTVMHFLTLALPAG